MATRAGTTIVDDTDGYQQYSFLNTHYHPVAGKAMEGDTISIKHFIMRGVDVDCAVLTPTYRTWLVISEPDWTGIYYFGPKCGASPLVDIIIVKELVI